jgi:hypothetical protein
MQAPSPLRRIVTLVVCLGAWPVVHAFAQEKPGWTPVPKEDVAMAEAMTRSMTPGAPHALLASLAGDWDVVTRMWMDPARPPAESSGTATNVMTLGGRYLQSTFRGHVLGMAFEGVSLMGFDNVTGQYQSAWIDNMSTTIMYATGSYDPAAKVITMRSEMSDLVNPRIKVPVREALTILDARTHRMEMFETRDGKERKSLEITYTRKR